MKFIFFTPVLLLLLLSGCATPNVSSDAIGAGATIQGTVREPKFANYDAFYLTSIDGASITFPVLRKSFQKPIAIGPGERILVLYYEGMNGFSKKPRAAGATVKVKIDPNESYSVDGRSEGNVVYLWVTCLSSGKKVSDEVLAGKADVSPQAPTLIPIVIPR